MRRKSRWLVVAAAAAAVLTGCTPPPPLATDPAAGDGIVFATSDAAAKAMTAALDVLTPLEAAGVLQQAGWKIPPYGFGEETLKWAPPRCGSPAVGYFVYLEATFWTKTNEWTAFIDTTSIVGYKLRAAAVDTAGRTGAYSLPFVEWNGPLDPGPEIEVPCNQ